MSIISEALKKAQRARTVTPGPSSTDAISDPPGETLTKGHPGFLSKSSFLRYPLIAAAAAVVMITFLVIPRFFEAPPAASAVQKNASVQGRGGYSISDRVQKTSPAQTETYKSVFPAYRQTPVASYDDTDPVLNGIMYLPTAPRAVINGRTVKEGDVVDGHTVTQILPDRVKLSSENGESELELR